MLRHFNPHPRVEGDITEPKLRYIRWHFNPHPRVEGDSSLTSSTASAQDFNPHPRVEGDDECRATFFITSDFNPHPRVEGDLWYYDSVKKSRQISIHTLAWRVTQILGRMAQRRQHFNPHPRVEGDTPSPFHVGNTSDFNPHPRVEGDSYSWYLLLLNIAHIESYTTLSS